jgi:predicted nuclease with TOPRIM domain
VPPALLEEVFELNEELDEIREQREAGAEPTSLASRLDAARAPIERKREEHEQQIEALSARWDGLPESATPAERRAALEALRETLLERNYINNLLATIEREGASVARSQEPKAERHG